MAAATKCSFEVLSHTPYSPDLAPLDFYLFPNRNFGSSEGIIDAIDEYLGDQEEGFYFKGISKL